MKSYINALLQGFPQDIHILCLKHVIMDSLLIL